ncbi:NAD(P)/FAD-dependent oxidoreductase [Radiobacillus sp. PE A8.2]|uniref:NAD(P)/FAD-dependent oxidoreductase n=1 Tax=Radiobacillus sp. PE A8.2 TaxID=3380349 RepID=UPI00388D5C1C
MQSIIVIGSGILGASTAYHLARQGVEVTIIDRNDPGQATSAAAGIICPWLTNRSNEAWYELVKAGASYYPDLIEGLKADGETETGYAQVGAINIFDTEEKLDRKLEIALKSREDAPEMGAISRLSPMETKALFPPLADHYWAVHISGAGKVDGEELRNALIRAAQKNGARVVNGDASLIFEDSTVTGVNVSGSSLYADKVIVTGGVWANQLLEPLGLKFNVTPQKAQIVHLQIPETDTSNWPVVLPPYSQYMLGFSGGRVVVGSTHEEEAGFDTRVTVNGVNQIISKALKVAPGLATSTYVETKVGLRPFTSGSLPIYGPVPHMKGLFVANGLGASGLTSGPFLGAELANLVLGNELQLDPATYDVSSAFY